ncbi:TIGR02678 family protein [Limnochorda pilosa]|uniref:TIGR02678 family protein n=1 Tax=Limnochorda pilosa TaxID=1555112 RepID=A0A0K2SM92_LIMPI|nr:TIGR02678 family protein [Limnochorda pilosa]BAS27949.1 hypothetical protein LIP_2108 [Limnochorda pilosa]
MPSYRVQDLQRPFIDLLDRVAIRAADDPLAYSRVHVHVERLRQWFASRPGWRVILRREFALLVKVPAAASLGYGQTWAQMPLDYELFAWALWYAERYPEGPFLLSHLVQEIEARAKVLIGPGHVDWNLYPHRLSLQRSLKALEAMGALTRLDSTDDWVQTGQGDTLYEFTPVAPYLEVHETIGSASELPGSAAPSEGPGGEAGSHLAPLPHVTDPRVRLYRTLLLSPAIYRCADPEAFTLLENRSRREEIASDLLETFGWDLEWTPSYAALLRPSASEVSEQMLFPFRGALAHILLLLFGEVRALVRRGELDADETDRVRLSPRRLSSLLAALRERHGEQWGLTIQREGLGSLLERVIDTLRAWELLDGPDRDGNLHLLPLAARFRGVYEGEEAEYGDFEDDPGMESEVQR